MGISREWAFRVNGISREWHFARGEISRERVILEDGGPDEPGDPAFEAGGGDCRDGERNARRQPAASDAVCAEPPIARRRGAISKPLFERKSGKMTLTPAGERLLQTA